MINTMKLKSTRHPRTRFWQLWLVVTPLNKVLLAEQRTEARMLSQAKINLNEMINLINNREKELNAEEQTNQGTSKIDSTQV